VSAEQQPSPQTTLFVRAASSDPTRGLPAFQAAIHAIEPGVVIGRPETMSAVAGASLQVMSLALWLLGAFAIVALLLSAIGVYGVMSYAVTQRMREFGTRVALGATPTDIVRLVMRYSTAVSGVGLAVGGAIGILGARSLSGLLFHVSVVDPLAIGSAAAVLSGATLAASYLPARRAGACDAALTISES
jgi:ABC-type antimicrobial peptide transport system permease subunit